MMKTDIPAHGVNKLTERLLAQGVTFDNLKTWPEDVWEGEKGNFCYSREYRFMPTWESPCGLLIHSHGDMWGETWVDGEFKCAENDNPLFRCPVPGKPCPHRLKLPKGINCQFHRTDREWSEEASVERIQREHDATLRRLWEEDIARYPGWNGVCACLDDEDLPDGTVRRTARWELYKCLWIGCTSTQCVCRGGAERDIRPANIFYDLYIERHFTEGLLEYTDKQVTKGLEVFPKPVARTDAELALKIWRHDPDSSMLPPTVTDKLNAHAQSTGIECFFVRHHQYWNGHVGVTMKIEIRNIHVARNEQRDMLQDLKDVQEGIEVIHDSDLKKAAQARKSESRQKYKINKLAKQYANSQNGGELLLWGEKPEMKKAVREEAERIKAKRDARQAKEDAKAAQITLFDMEGED